MKPVRMPASVKGSESESGIENGIENGIGNGNGSGSVLPRVVEIARPQDLEEIGSLRLRLVHRLHTVMAITLSPEPLLLDLQAAVILRLLCHRQQDRPVPRLKRHLSHAAVAILFWQHQHDHVGVAVVVLALMKHVETFRAHLVVDLGVQDLEVAAFTAVLQLDLVVLEGEVSPLLHRSVVQVTLLLLPIHALCASAIICRICRRK